MNIFTNWTQTDGLAHSAIIVHTCGSCIIISILNTCYKGMVECIGGYILEQSVSVRAAPELIVADGGAAVEFFDKASSPFCIPGARQC